MGCWYETCAFSGLPICPGDQAVLVLLRPGRGRAGDGRAGFSNPTDQWTPLVLPFRGKYNDDRGTIGRAAAKSHKQVTGRLLQEHGLKLAPALFKTIERGEVAVEKGFLRGPVGQMLVRQDIWDYLLGMTLTTAWARPTQTRARYRQDMEFFVDFWMQNQEEARKGISEKSALEWKLTDGDSHILYWLHNNPEVAVLSLYRIQIGGDLVRGDIDREAALAVMYEVADLFYLNEVLHALRRAWRPQPGKGSQDTEYEMHRDFALEVARIAQAEFVTDD